MLLRYLPHISNKLMSSGRLRFLSHGGKLIRKPAQLHPYQNKSKTTETHVVELSGSTPVSNLKSTNGKWHTGGRAILQLIIARLLSKLLPEHSSKMACSLPQANTDTRTAPGPPGPVRLSAWKTEDLSPPPSVKGMTELDRDRFKKSVHVPGLQVPVTHIATLNKLFKDMFLKMPGIKPLASLDESHVLYATHKLFLLDPRIFTSPSNLNERQLAALNECGISQEDIKLYELELGYKNWTYQEILKVILQESSDSVAGFSTIGHILHLNLRDEVLEYKEIIGRVLLDKVPTARTVVNKLNKIDNTFRNFEMEVLAGDDDMLTTTKEHGFTFKMDFSKVYWNPRLGTEHQRVVGGLSKDDVVYDVFAGVGPFAIPAAKKRCTVLANDLNPHSQRWLKENVTVNKVNSNCNTYNLDGREFIRTVVKDDLLRRWAEDPSPSGVRKFHVVMNLPALAVEFLDAFSGLFEGVSRTEEWKSFSLPMVYCYCFSSEGGIELDTKERIRKSLGAPLGDGSEIRFVRKVAPNKDMMCVMFELPETILYSSRHVISSTESGDPFENSPPPKRRKPEL